MANQFFDSLDIVGFLALIAMIIVVYGIVVWGLKILIKECLGTSDKESWVIAACCCLLLCRGNNRAAVSRYKTGSRTKSGIQDPAPREMIF